MDKDIDFIMSNYWKLLSKEEIDNLNYLSYELDLEDGHAISDGMRTLNDVLRRFNIQNIHLPTLVNQQSKIESRCDICKLPVISIYSNLETNKSGHKHCIRS